jgi:hypothetical protein
VLGAILEAAIAEEEWMYYKPNPVIEFLESVYSTSPALAEFLLSLALLGAFPGPLIALMLWIVTIYVIMTRVDEKDAMHNLKDGFIFSLITVSALLAILLLSWDQWCNAMLPFSFPFVFAIFILGWCNRVKAWEKLKQKRIKNALLCENIVFIITVCLVEFYAILPRFFSLIIFTSPIIAWITATYMEANGFEWIKQNLNINLSLSRKMNILGITFSIIGVAIQFIQAIPYQSLVIWAFIPRNYTILLSYPFLIASCLSTIIRLRPKSFTINKPV